MQKPIGGRSKRVPAEKKGEEGVGKTIGSYQGSIFVPNNKHTKTTKTNTGSQLKRG